MLDDVNITWDKNDDPDRLEKQNTKIRHFTINFGPQHPAAHGVLRLILELHGKRLFVLILMSDCYIEVLKN